MVRFLGVKDICLHFLDDEEVENFARWAVGEDFKKIKNCEWRSYWNDLHGNELKIESSEEIVQSISKMIRLWIKEGE